MERVFAKGFSFFGVVTLAVAPSVVDCRAEQSQPFAVIEVSSPHVPERNETNAPLWAAIQAVPAVSTTTVSTTFIGPAPGTTSSRPLPYVISYSISDSRQRFGI